MVDPHAPEAGIWCVAAMWQLKLGGVPAAKGDDCADEAIETFFPLFFAWMQALQGPIPLIVVDQDRILS